MSNIFNAAGPDRKICHAAFEKKFVDSLLDKYPERIQIIFTQESLDKYGLKDLKRLISQSI